MSLGSANFTPKNTKRFSKQAFGVNKLSVILFAQIPNYLSLNSAEPNFRPSHI